VKGNAWKNDVKVTRNIAKQNDIAINSGWEKISMYGKEEKGICGLGKLFAHNISK